MPAVCPQRIPQWKLWKIATNHLNLEVYPANQFNLITRIDQNSSPVKALVLTASLLSASTKLRGTGSSKMWAVLAV
jgi:hypothetical protein